MQLVLKVAWNRKLYTCLCVCVNESMEMLKQWDKCLKMGHIRKDIQVFLCYSYLSTFLQSSGMLPNKTFYSIFIKTHLLPLHLSGSPSPYFLCGIPSVSTIPCHSY